MWENKENQPAEMSDSVQEAIQEEAKLSYAELELKFAEAERLRDWHASTARERQERISYRKGQVDQVEEYIRENWDDLGDHGQAIADLLEIALTSTKTFDFEVRVTVEVEANSPAFDWSGFDGSEIDLDISANVAWGHREEISDATVEDTEITSCDEA